MRSARIWLGVLACLLLAAAYAEARAFHRQKRGHKKSDHRKKDNYEKQKNRGKNVWKSNYDEDTPDERKAPKFVKTPVPAAVPYVPMKLQLRSDPLRLATEKPKGKIRRILKCPAPCPQSCSFEGCTPNCCMKKLPESSITMQGAPQGTPPMAPPAAPCGQAPMQAPCGPPQLPPPPPPLPPPPPPPVPAPAPCGRGVGSPPCKQPFAPFRQQPPPQALPAEPAAAIPPPAAAVPQKGPQVMENGFQVEEMSMTPAGLIQRNEVGQGSEAQQLMGMTAQVMPFGNDANVMDTAAVPPPQQPMMEFAPPQQQMQMEPCTKRDGTPCAPVPLIPPFSQDASMGVNIPRADPWMMAPQQNRAPPAFAACPQQCAVACTKECSPECCMRSTIPEGQFQPMAQMMQPMPGQMDQMVQPMAQMAQQPQSPMGQMVQPMAPMVEPMAPMAPPPQMMMEMPKVEQPQQQQFMPASDENSATSLFHHASSNEEQFGIPKWVDPAS